MSEENRSLSAQVETIVVPDGNAEGRAAKGKARQKSYVLDLRIHSPASLGYLSIEGIDTAPALVRLAKVKGLDIIAVSLSIELPKRRKAPR
jgi:hypothetical protein